ILAETQIADRVASRRSIETQQLLAGLLSLTQDAETGQRGYLLTGEKTYLQPYQHAVEALPGQLARIDQMLPASSEAAQQVAGIKEALARKQSELAETIRLYDAGNMSKALEIVRGGSSKLDMEQIQANIDAIRRIDGANLQARALRMEQVEDWLRAGSFAALAAILLLGLYTIRESGRRFRAVVIAQDALSAKNAALENEIHTRERAESQLRQVQKMEAVGQLTGGIAHDFNNMLAVITFAMNLAQRKLARGEHDVETFVEAAADAAARAANLTARLLAFSRQQPLAPQLVDANRLVTGMSDLLRRTLGQSIEIETVLAGGLWKAHADPSQVENAILNLAVNARDAIGEKGKLTIETANCHLDEAYAAGHPEVKAGQYVMIAVTDTGTGMSPDVMA
ncbi:CHASE3 domain-containing protein, partial [Mesorhizobium sp.]|uniref:CHASE3 domain-containing protein n=1 Tax=Mesorhizobium sp. TaxID=1871066 RepID=UPI000FE72BC2